MINVAYIADENYVLPTTVSIRSLVKNAKDTTECAVYVILSGNVSEQSKQKLRECSTHNISIKIIEAQMQMDIEEKIPNHLYVSKAALLKFSLANLLPDLDKVLYLDGDTIIQKDLSQLYTVDICNYSLAAVVDLAAMVGEWHRKLNVPMYFNSGVMLINLKKWREEDTKFKLVEYKLHEKYPGSFMDQNTLNAVFCGKVKFVDICFNYMPANLKMITEEDLAKVQKVACFTETMEKCEIDEYCNDATILHLTNQKKVWKDLDADYYDVWTKYTDSTEVWPCLRNYYLTQNNRLNSALSESNRIIEENRQQIKELQLKLEDSKRQIGELQSTLDSQSRQMVFFEQKLAEVQNQLRYYQHRTIFGALRYVVRKLLGKATDD